MKRSNKSKLAIFEYGAIIAFIAVIVFATTQVMDAKAFGVFNALNAVSLNAVTDAPAGDMAIRPSVD